MPYVCSDILVIVIKISKKQSKGYFIANIIQTVIKGRAGEIINVNQLIVIGVDQVQTK